MKFILLIALIATSALAAEEKKAEDATKSKRGLGLSFGGVHHHAPAYVAHAPVVHHTPIVAAAPAYVAHAPLVHHAPIARYHAPVIAHSPFVHHAPIAVAHAPLTYAHHGPVYSSFHHY